MSLRSILLIIISVLIAAFVAANWTVMTSPTDLSLIFTTVYAPVGVVMLCLLGVMALVFITFVAYLQSSVLVETRRQSKELAAQRDLADKAEASRFTELRAYLNTELARLNELSAKNTEAIHARVDRLEMGLREQNPEGDLQRLAELSEQHANSIQARVDRLEMGLREVDSQRPVATQAVIHQPAASPVTPVSELGQISPGREN